MEVVADRLHGSIPTFEDVEVHLLTGVPEPPRAVEAHRHHARELSRVGTRVVEPQLPPVVIDLGFVLPVGSDRPLLALDERDRGDAQEMPAAGAATQEAGVAVRDCCGQPLP